jgi:hypothetical protein
MREGKLYDNFPQNDHVDVFAGFLLAGLATGAWSQVPTPTAPTTGPTVPFGGELEGAMSVKGSVVCVDCTVEEVRQTRSGLTDLYELTHEKGQVVMKVDSVNNAFRWETLVGLSHQVSVRASDNVWQKLTAEENLFKEIGLGGILSKTRTFDIGEVTTTG